MPKRHVPRHGSEHWTAIRCAASEYIFRPKDTYLHRGLWATLNSRASPKTARCTVFTLVFCVEDRLNAQIASI